MSDSPFVLPSVTKTMVATLEKYQQTSREVVLYDLRLGEIIRGKIKKVTHETVQLWRETDRNTKSGALREIDLRLVGGAEATLDEEPESES